MSKRIVLVSVLCLGVFTGAGVWRAAQQENPNTIFRVDVNMVQLDVAVTDKKGNYVSGLSPWDFEISEDGIPQKLATFREENEAPRRLEDYPRPGTQAAGASAEPARAQADPADPSPDSLQNGPTLQPLMQSETPDQMASMVEGASVFILFDTSNYMYHGFVFAQDAIAQFVRSLDRPYRVALYSYSRNFSRVCTLTPDRSLALGRVRQTVAGDNAALYDALLMTLKDAGRFSGRRVVVAFSNGPDNASMVAPEDVRELAQTEGVPIYMVSTQQAKLDPVSTAVFERMSNSTGGKSYFAKNWQEQQQAFNSIRADLNQLYTLAYYPQPNPNLGWRSITVTLVGERLKNCRVRTRSGYRPRTEHHFTQAAVMP
jgi:VWFA-related protein